MLAERTLAKVVEAAKSRGASVVASIVDLREFAADLTPALLSRVRSDELADAVQAIDSADGVIVSSPVYHAGPSALLTSFLQSLDDDLLIGKPVLLAATAGTSRHALVVDGQIRSLFAYLRALTVPTSVFAASEDWNDKALEQRVKRAALELVLLMESGFATQIRELSWNDYRHEYGSSSDSDLQAGLDPDMMRLAAGGSLLDGDPDKPPVS